MVRRYDDSIIFCMIAVGIHSGIDLSNRSIIRFSKIDIRVHDPVQAIIPEVSQYPDRLYELIPDTSRVVILHLSDTYSIVPGDLPTTLVRLDEV